MEVSKYLHDAQLLSLVLVCVTFTLIVAYALWPSLEKNFNEAARLPLNED